MTLLRLRSIELIVLTFAIPNNNKIKTRVPKNEISSLKRNVSQLFCVIPNTKNMFIARIRSNARGNCPLQQQCRKLFSIDSFSQQQKTWKKSPDSAGHNIFHELKTLSTTQNWRRATDFIASNEFHCTRSSLGIFNNLMANAFLDADHELGWNLLHKIIESHFQPDCRSFQAYWDYCTVDGPNFPNNIEKMLEFIAQNDIIISKTAIKELGHKIEHFGGSAVSTHMDGDGACEKCHSHLQRIQHSALEFYTLKREFEKVFIKSKISADELFVFRQMVNKKKTFDYIIDALNVTRVFPESKGNILKQAKLLVRLVEQLREQNSRVFVVGKKHINHWPEQSINFVRKNATVYLTKDAGSIDDLLVMYAAFISGPDAHFVTNDLLDEHFFEFSEVGRKLFKKWQKQHQHFVSYDVEKDVIQIQRPNRFICSANKDLENGNWHLPYTDRPLMISLRGLVRVPIRWGCVKLQTNK